MNFWRIALLPAVLIYFAAAANVGICPQLAIEGLAPDLLVALAVSWIWLAAGTTQLMAVAGIGLAYDLCGDERLGVGMACFLLAGMALEAIQRRMAYHHPVLRLSSALLVVVVLELSLISCEWIAAGMELELATLLNRGLGMGVYTAVITGLALGVATPLVQRRQFS